MNAINSISINSEEYNLDNKDCTRFMWMGTPIYIHGSFKSQLDFAIALTEKITETMKRGKNDKRIPA